MKLTRETSRATSRVDRHCLVMVRWKQLVFFGTATLSFADVPAIAIRRKTYSSPE
jgi:hypothetical protein